MNSSQTFENEKNKVKQTSETESYEAYEIEAMENAEEGSNMEKVSFSENDLPSNTCESATSISVLDRKARLEGGVRDSYEERKRLLMLEKWFTVTGKKPRSIPTVKKYFDEKIDNIVLFGDRKPQDIEQNRRKKMLLAAKKIQSLGVKYGKVRQEVKLPALYQGLLCIKFAPDGEFIATCDRAGRVQIRKSYSGEVAINLRTEEYQEKLSMRSLKYHPQDNEKLYAGGDTGVIQVFNTYSGALLGTSVGLNTVNVLDISPDGYVLATGGRAGKVCVLDAQTLQMIWTRAWPKIDETVQFNVEDKYCRLRIYGLKFHPTEPNLFATGGWDNSLKIWDIRIPEAIRSIRGPAIYGSGLDISNGRILTASWRAENSLSLWDFSSGHLIKNIPIKSKFVKFEGEFVYVAKFFKDDPNFSSVNSNMIAVGGSGFTELVVIDIGTEKILEHFPSYKSTFTLDVFGNLIAYGGKESIFRIAEIDDRWKSLQSRGDSSTIISRGF